MITVTDLFSGAGGSTTGAIQVPGVHVRIAANHFQIVTDIHALNHPETDHAVVDLHLERPSFFPKTDMLWASPECTKWSQANGAKLPAIDEGLFEDPLSDDAKTRSRLLMFDVLRFIEYHRYRLVIVENVVDIATQAQYRTAWTIWRQELRALGYEFRVVSLNSMHAQMLGAPAPQSRDRIYIVAWPEGAKAPDLDRVVRPRAHCDRCDTLVDSVQSFKPNRTVGRYRQAYVYCCPRCGSIVEPGWLPAAAAIDWSIPGERVGDRLKPKTRARIAAGIARYWGPLHIEATGNTYDAADPNHLHYGDPDGYYRAWPTSEPKSLHTTNSKALAVPVEGRDGKEARPVEAPFRTLTTRAETAFVAEMYGTSTARSVVEPAGTFTAGGNHHGLAQKPLVASYHQDRLDLIDPTVEHLPTTTAGGIHEALVQDPFILDRRFEYRVRSIDDPISTITANDTSKALIHRMNTGGAEMTTPAWEELRTLTTAGHQAILRAPASRKVTLADLKAAEEMVPDVLFRMFQPHEVAAGMAFPRDYKWQPPDRNKPISNRDLVKAAGNAVTPPCSRDLVGVCRVARTRVRGDGRVTSLIDPRINRLHHDRVVRRHARRLNTDAEDGADFGDVVLARLAYVADLERHPQRSHSQLSERWANLDPIEPEFVLEEGHFGDLFEPVPKQHFMFLRYFEIARGVYERQHSRTISAVTGGRDESVRFGRWDSNPRKALTPLLAFQASALGHYATPPNRAGEVRSVLIDHTQRQLHRSGGTLIVTYPSGNLQERGEL